MKVYWAEIDVDTREYTIGVDETHAIFAQIYKEEVFICENDDNDNLVLRVEVLSSPEEAKAKIYNRVNDINLKTLDLLLRKPEV